MDFGTIKFNCQGSNHCVSLEFPLYRMSANIHFSFIMPTLHHPISDVIRKVDPDPLVELIEHSVLIIELKIASWLKFRCFFIGDFYHFKNPPVATPRGLKYNNAFLVENLGHNVKSKFEYWKIGVLEIEIW